MMTNTMTNTISILLLLLCNNIITNNILINAQQIITATYNSNYTAPTCLTPAMKCETVDPSWGIDGVGFYEPNSPNTIDDCVDYSNTYYGRDEYIMKLLVRNVDGDIITGGTNVRITTRINTAENTTTRIVPDDEEVVHFYYTRNVTSTPINWEYITTKTRDTGVGESTIHTSVSLDYQGGLQAVRVNLGYGIYTPRECASDGLTNGDSYVDVDDLVFYVVPGPPSVSPTSSQTNTDVPTMMPSVLTSEPSSSPSGKSQLMCLLLYQLVRVVMNLRSGLLQLVVKLHQVSRRPCRLVRVSLKCLRLNLARIQQLKRLVLHQASLQYLLQGCLRTCHRVNQVGSLLHLVSLPRDRLVNSHQNHLPNLQYIHPPMGLR